MSDDGNLSRLKEKLDKISENPNMFEILGISREEYRHSNFLGRLMSPKKSGKMGEEILEKISRKMKKRVRMLRT